MRNYIICFIFLLLSLFSYSQQVRPESSTSIYKDIKMLHTLPRVLYLAAHPDDENTGLLSWLVNDQHIRTGYLSLTRGDGGQNLLGSEQGAALGLIRTHELLEARKLDGAEQYFTRAIDFGFSKSSEDTFKQWDIDTITADVVRVIREFKPDVIICRFPPTSAAGHGQHAASAIIAEKAFKAAGDKNYHMNQSHKAWQAKRLLWNTYNFGRINTTDNNQFKVTTGQYDPLLGMGYGELAGKSRSLHKSQGAGTQSIPGLKTEYFTLVAGDPVRSSLFDGIDTSWTSIGRADIDRVISAILEDFDFKRPDLSIPALLKLKKQVEAIDDNDLRNDKLAAIDKLILSCAGLMAEMVTDKAEATAGESLGFELRVVTRSEIPVKLLKVNWLNEEEFIDRQLFNDSLTTFSHRVNIPENAEISAPYWLKKPSATSTLYQVDKPALIGSAVAPASLNVLLTLQLGDENFEVKIPLSHKELDPVKGDVIEGLRVVPAVNVKFLQPLFFTTASTLDVAVNLRTNKDISNASLALKSAGKAIASKTGITLREDTDTTLHFSIPPERIDRLEIPQLHAELRVENKVFSKDQQLIQYSHLPTLQYFTAASAQLVKGDIAVKAKKIGYIEGAGDLIPEFLRLAGLDVTILKESDLSDAAQLRSFDAIVTGIRILNIDSQAKRWLPVLLDYVHAGGTLIMQYNKSQHLLTDRIGPYPLSINSRRVAEEDADVTFLDPKHPLLNYPNTISKNDFHHWVQERGIYFPSDWDDRYEPLFEMNDMGEQSLKGAVLYTKYGKGNYIYTSLSFFRQLPIGHIGATKLFFNMLSIGK